MSPAHVLEPTYRKLKSGLTRGAWPAGNRLEALRLAEEFGVSMTPVRDSLNRLVGERLVDFRPGEGYRVPLVTEQHLRDLLDLHLLMINHALHSAEADRAAPLPSSGLADYAEELSSLFGMIGSWSQNSVLEDCLRLLGDRLTPARRAEPCVVRGAEERLTRMKELARRSDPELPEEIAAYHEESCAHASAILRHLGESGR
jgi:DNA-binding transcriptional regulator YhcF (GntR family)